MTRRELEYSRSPELSLSHKAENCLVASAWIKPESQIVDTPEIFKITNTAAPYGFMNGIYRTQFSTGTSDAVVDIHSEFYRKNNIGFRWYVFPHSSPPGLESKLTSINPLSITELQGMYLDVHSTHLETPVDVTVESVTSANLEEYIDTVVAGWRQSGQEAEQVRRDIRHDFKGTPPFSAFLARYNGEAAATGLIRYVDDVGYFFGGSTDPRFRGKGVYRGLVAERLRSLREKGVAFAMVLARKSSSAPICRKLGFQAACDVKSFDF